MARFRAKIPDGTIALVGDLRFYPGQLLPEGVTEYQVLGTLELSPEEQYDDTEEIAYSVRVPVELNYAGVREAIQETIDAIIENQLSFASTGFLSTDGSLTYFNA